MEHSAFLPYDIALRIASSLPVRDVCALGSCSRFWRQVCGSDRIWVSLCKQRWPSLLLTDHSYDHASDPFFKGWRAFYVERHGLMASIATNVVNFVQQHSSFITYELGDKFCPPGFEFEDVQLFLFRQDNNVLINFAGLLYCINYLRVPLDYLMEALEKCKISERRVFVKWRKLVRRPNQCMLEAKSNSCWVALGNLVTGKEEEVLQVIQNERKHHLLLRVKICIAESDEA